MTERWDTPYAELHAHSCYSLCDGVPTPEALAARAAELGLPALALTDHNTVSGVVPFVRACQEHGLHPIVGAELTLAGGFHLTLLVEDRRGWSNLCALITSAQAAAPKGEALLSWDDLPPRAEGLFCLTGCRHGPLAGALRRIDTQGALRAARWLRDTFGSEHLAVEVQHHLHPGDSMLVGSLVELAGHLRLPAVATNNIHYLRRSGQRTHELLTAIRHRSSLADAGRWLRGNSEYYLKRGGQLRPLFRDTPEVLAATLEIAGRCRYTPRYGLQDLPRFPTPREYDAAGYLKFLCEQALPHRMPDRAEAARQQLAHELAVIERAGLANYFLIVWDIVRYARRNGIRCQGRGSAANSLVAYLLEISPVDPLAHDLVFERFLSDERPALPDIDLDIAADRREEVIQYVFGRYGAEHAAMACTFSTFGERSAVRDVARALDITVEHLAVTGDHTTDATRTLARELCASLEGLPRHLGQHNGGMVLTAAPLCERVPVEPAAMAGRRVVQWDKDMLEDAGLIKIDLLGLRMLSALTEAEQIAREVDPRVCLDCLQFDDAAVYEMISAADTVGVFQVESRAQAQILPKLEPRCFDDLVIAISLIRPGPLQGDMVHPYLRRRLGLEPVSYPHPLLEAALRDTLGVILFQEQVLKVARDLAGLTAGQGEQLRRALGSGRGPEAVAPLREAFVAGAERRGVARGIAEGVFRQLEAFGGYSFPKSHALAFAVIVYQSAWLKRYHPAPFLAALLNHQPMGFWPPAILVRDARRHGVMVVPLDIQRSAARCRVEAGRVWLGLNYVHGLGESGAERIVAAGQASPFANLDDLCRRTRLPRRLVEHLILAGACDGWGVARRQLLWKLGTLRYAADELDLPVVAEEVTLPEMSEDAAQRLQERLLGVSTGEHMLARWRAALMERGYLATGDVPATPAGQRVRLLGTVAMHQAPPTAKGFHFLTLEDEQGMLNVVVRPYLAPLARTHAHPGALLEIEGVVQHEAGVTNVQASWMRQRTLSKP